MKTLRSGLMMGAEVCSTNLPFPSLSPSGGAVHGKLREVYPCRENVDCVSRGGGGGVPYADLPAVKNMPLNCEGSKR